MPLLKLSLGRFRGINGSSNDVYNENFRSPWEILFPYIPMSNYNVRFLIV